MLATGKNSQPTRKDVLTARLGGSNKNRKQTTGIQPKSARETRKLPLARGIGGSSVLI
jgi:hypothetical protein